MGTFFLICALNAFISISTSNCFLPSSRADLERAPEASGRVRAIKEMNMNRAAHTATLLNDGRVLIAGGFGNGETSLAQAEIFLPSTSSFETTGPLSVSRASHSATLLPDGRVLMAGGYNGEYLDSSEIYDPKTGRFSRGGRMTMPRSEHTATTLSDGRILLAGGVGTGWTFLAEAEIYDPRTGTFTATGRMRSPRESHTATLLNNGKVLITGGHKDRRAAMTIFASTEIYDPAREAFEPAADMTIKRHKHAAVLLRDGRVLVVGGSDERDSQGAYTSLEIFEPESGRFRKVGEMTSSRYKLNGAVILLRNGKVLLAGGAAKAEVFEPSKSSISSVDGTFGSKRLFATATLLKTGSVLITGGYDDSMRVGQEAWIFEQGATGKME